MNIRDYLYFFSAILILNIFFNCTSQPDVESSVNHEDSIKYYLNNSKNIEKAILYNEQVEVESLKLKYASKIALQALQLSDSLRFLKANSVAFNLSKRYNDSTLLAETYWNRASFYYKCDMIDSSFFYYQRAYKIYSELDNEFYKAKMLYNLSFLQGRVKDYLGSESNIFKAINIYKNLDKNLSLYKSYKLLGNLYLEVEDYENALKYHLLSLDCLNKNKNKEKYISGFLNDIGVVYKTYGRYDKALESFQEGLADMDIRNRDSAMYARLVDNLAHTYYLQGNYNDSVGDKLIEAHAIRKKLGNNQGLIISKLHLADYYFKKNDSLMVLNNALEAKNLAEKLKNNQHVLSSLSLIGKVDPKNADQYFNEYIQVSEELQNYERKLKNSVAKIQFETAEQIEKNEKLSNQKSAILLITSMLVLFFILLYFFMRQKMKFRTLEFQNRQRDTNEKIYELMLKQQSQLEEGRIRERKRISEELHDGVLGKIFGTRMSLGFLKLEDDFVKTKLNKYAKELQEIEKEIRTISHDLKNENFATGNDFKHLIDTFLKDQSEIANFNYNLNINPIIDWETLDKKIIVNFYRIIQEAVQNTIKHANAQEIDVEISKQNQELTLQIRDNGVGMDKTKIKRKKGIGILNMKSRIESLKGTFEIVSSRLVGTTILIKCPILIDET